MGQCLRPGESHEALGLYQARLTYLRLISQGGIILIVEGSLELRSQNREVVQPAIDDGDPNKSWFARMLSGELVMVNQCQLLHFFYARFLI